MRSFLFISCCLIPSTLAPQAQTFSIDWSSIDAGGGASTGGVYSVTGTIGQPDAGPMNGGIYSLTGGFQIITAAGAATFSITTQPSDATNKVFTTATFTVQAQSGSQLEYQWRLDGAPLVDNRYVTGSNGPVLVINCMRHADAGLYDVVISEAGAPQNTLISKPARLVVEGGFGWVLRATNGPPPRFYHGLAYDSARHVTILFGGQTNMNGTFPFNDLWEWDGGRWTQRVPNSKSNGWTFVTGRGWQLAPETGPVQRSRHATAYDHARGRLVVFGGISLDPGGNIHYLKDLWEWDGTRWYFRGTNGPIARFDGSMAYDARRGRTVFFGGLPVGRPGEVNDVELVWEWDGQRWFTNQAAAKPSSINNRAQARMVYDSFRGVTVFGPTYENYAHWAFWDWDGAQWTNFPVVHFADPIVSALNGTGSGGFTFDDSRRRSTWFGGSGLALGNKTAFFDGRQWTLLTNSTAAPSPRMLHAMAFDSDRRAAVMFGGTLVTSGTVGATNDTWELIPLDVPVINEQPLSQYRQAGDTAVFTVKAVGHGTLQYQWYFGSAPLPEARTDTLTISSVRAQNAGQFSVLISNQCGATWSQPAVLTLSPKLQIFPRGKKATLVWSDPELVLDQADDPGGPWLLVPDVTSPFDPAAIGPGKFFRLREANP